ncbi:hypothetical protein [Mesorhizobium sp. WSM3860]|uniref:hypothetical protein n=1 Tax=Mesorhizobium sp. WSM3860 TaxID=2029403 RepID=UPI001140A69E|nr:hypothetical protein [Mesorhizobium sp. WSM3860]
MSDKPSLFEESQRRNWPVAHAMIGFTRDREPNSNTNTDFCQAQRRSGPAGGFAGPSGCEQDHQAIPFLNLRSKWIRSESPNGWRLRTSS